MSRCEIHGMFDPAETQTKECPKCLEVQRDRYREALEAIYATPMGYQDACWNLAADALNKPRPH